MGRGAAVRTRLAPTPSGFLHLGNAANFLLCWLFARTQGGEVCLRIEDTDTTRRRTEFVESLFRDLEWLGLDWDEGPSGPGDSMGPWFQSSPSRQARYREVMEAWTALGHLFPCRCSRKDLSLAAPQVARLDQAQGLGSLYPGTCQVREPAEAGPSDAWRLRLPGRESSFADLWRGRQDLSNMAGMGAPVLRRGDGCFAYHLAVCVDDFDQGITHVVRGRDLLPWTHLHLHLHSLLGGDALSFGHHPLLGGLQGERLAKSAGSTSLRALREGGVSREAVLGQLSRFLHPKSPATQAISLEDLLGRGLPDPGLIDLPLVV